MCTIYRTPDSLVEWFDHFSDMFDHAHAEDKEIIMMGDINLDFLKPEEVAKRWFRIMDHLSQLIDEPTRIKSGSKTCIDHIYVTNPEHVRAKNVPHIGLSDHFPVCYVPKHNSTSPTGTHNTIKYRLYKNFDEQAFL